jgi:outer membrane biosynthesis protein TonB
MPSLPDIPGKSLISGMTNRTKVVVATAGAGALAIGGIIVKRVLGHGAKDDDGGTGASADPIAETPTAPPGAEEKPVPKPKPAKPKAKAAKPKPAEPKAEKPKPAKDQPAPKAKAEPKPKAEPKAAKPKAAKAPKPAGKDPHAELNNPVVDDPDLSAYPDPYDTSDTTDELPLQVDPEVENGGKPPRRDNLDD